MHVLAVRPWRIQGGLSYLVALLHLSFFRFDVLVNDTSIDSL
jgi:hypothetical protein